MVELKGKIVPFTIERSKNYGDLSLGICWMKRNTTELLKSSSIINVKGREFIVPVNDGYLVKKAVEMIDSASEEIHLSSFLIQKGELTDALINASKRGSFVSLLTAREQELSMSEDEIDSLSTSRAEAIKGHKELLDQFAGNVLVRTSQEFHAKYILIDPMTRPAGIIMTCNATVDAMNGSNIEMAVTLKPDEVRSIFYQHIHGFWDMANHELFEKGKLEPVIKDQVPIKYGSVSTPGTYSNVRFLRAKVIELIRDSKDHLILSSWTFEEGHDVLKELENALSRGIKVEIFTRFKKDSPRNTASLLSILKKGASVAGHARFHAKVILADDKKGLLMTANYSSLGLDSGYEAGIELNDEDVKAMVAILKTLGQACDYSLRDNIRLKDAPEKLLGYSAKSGVCTDINVQNSVTKSLPEKHFSTCYEMIDYAIPDSFFPKNGENNTFYRAIVLKQFLKPPVLPSEAKLKEQSDVPFNVYSTGKNGKNLYITVQTWESLRMAKPYAEQLNAKVVLPN